MTIEITLATLAYNAYNYFSKPSEPQASAELAGKGDASQLFCDVGENGTEPLHTLPDRLPPALQELQDRWTAQEQKGLTASERSISSQRPSGVLINV